MGIPSFKSISVKVCESSWANNFCEIDEIKNCNVSVLFTEVSLIELPRKCPQTELIGYHKRSWLTSLSHHVPGAAECRPKHIVELKLLSHSLVAPLNILNNIKIFPAIIFQKNFINFACNAFYASSESCDFFAARPHFMPSPDRINFTLLLVRPPHKLKTFLSFFSPPPLVFIMPWIFYRALR